MIVVLLAAVPTRRRWVSHQPGGQMTMTINSRTMASGDRHLAMLVIALGIAARMARSIRTHETAIVVAITIAAVAGLGRASGARSVARLAAWDQRRQSERTMQTKRARKPRG